MGNQRKKLHPWSESGLRHVVAATALPNYHLHLIFDDGKSGTVDILWLIEEFRGMFSPLEDQEFFARVYVDPESLVVAWPNGADLDSDVLYSFATDAPIKLYPSRHSEHISVEDQLKALESAPA